MKVSAGREVHLRLPPDLSEELKTESAKTGMPQNRIIEKRLRHLMLLEQRGDRPTPASLRNRHDSVITRMEKLVKHHKAHLDRIDATENLLRAVDEIIDAKPNWVLAKRDGLWLAYNAWKALQ
jgi:hypothetical protein